MSYNDLTPFTTEFTPALKTSREKIKLIVHFLVSGRGTGFYLSYLPGMPDAQEEIQQEVFTEADAVTHRWALQFTSADAAVDRSSYDSLTHELSTIVSERFVIRKVTVQQIIPLTDRLPVTTSGPVQRPLEEVVAHPVIEAVRSFKVVKALQDTLPKTEPELWNDPFLGGLTTTVLKNGVLTPEDGKLKRLLDNAAAQAMTPKDGPR